MFRRAGAVTRRHLRIGQRLFMLDQMRQAASGGVSKLLMGLLVLSFAIWGIGGFQGYGTGTLATVGDEPVTVVDYQRTADQLQRSGRQMSPDQVFQQLLLAAALDDEARANNLGVSSDRVRREIVENPAFHGADGNYDPDVLTAVLNNAGMSRDDFVEDVREDMVRGQIAAAIGAGVGVPQPLIEALYRYRNEERTVSFIVLDETVIQPVGTPGDGDLQAYFEENVEDFRAPEFRRLGLLVVDPAAIADPEAVTEEELAAEYERREANFTHPERRRVEQIRFESREAAEAAVAGGPDFAALAESRGLTTADIDLGLKTKAEFIDPAIAEAAFAAEVNAVVPVLEGALEPSLIRVTEIEAGSVTPLEEVAPRLRQEIALRGAADQVQDLYDQVEDERDTGATLEEIASTLSLPYRAVEVAADGTGPDGQAISDIPGQAQVIEDAFQSDVGVVNNPVRAENNVLVFYDVLEVVAERERTLDEVRDQLAATWQAEETERRVAETAEALLARLRGGAALASLAAEIGKPVETIEGVTRSETPPGLSDNAAAQAFAGPEGHVANADGAEPPSRILLRVDDVTAPAYFAEATDAQAAEEQLSQAIEGGIRRAYYQELLRVRDIDINNAAYAQLTGTAETQQ
jgi:peptidyl-prolyl cis-trans isomerase D